MDNGIGEDMVGLGDTGHRTLADMLQFLGNRNRSSLDVVDNRSLAHGIHMGARPMWPKAEAPAWPVGIAPANKNRRRGPAVARTKGVLAVLGLFLTFGLIDRAVAQQQQPSQNQVGQPQVQIVPQTPGYQAPKPYQFTTQTSQPTPMYPQSQPRRQSGR